MTGQAGLLVSFDGPGGCGKSTIAALTARQLTDQGIPVHQTTQPSPTPLGQLIRSGTDTYRGMALACLVAGDRHHQLAAEILPSLTRGEIVLCDRYLPSSFVLQRMDGLSWEIVSCLNEGVTRPDLAVILNASPPVIAARLAGRGGHSRFERQPGSSLAESSLYRDTAARLAGAGWPVCVIDVTTRGADDTARIVASHVQSLRTDANRSSHEPCRPVPADVQHR
jgi:dTMP kinase